MSSDSLKRTETVEIIKDAAHKASLLNSSDSRKKDFPYPPFRVVGGGSKDFYGEVLKGVPLPTSAYQGILSYEPSELYITAMSGTPLREIEAVLEEKGQYLPFESPNFNGDSTLGGVVAAGISGPARASVGAVRDYVLGLKMINGRAQELVFGGQVMKNVAGYDVSRLLCGSWGTLGLITEVSLKVLPKALAERTIEIEVEQDKAIQLLSKWGQTAVPLNASVWELRAMQSGVPTLSIRLRGAIAAVQAGGQWIAKQCALENLHSTDIDAHQAQKFWYGFKNQTAQFFVNPPSQDDCLWRLSVPTTTPEIKIPGITSIKPQAFEWNAAQRWFWAPVELKDKIQSVAAELGGSAVLWRTSQNEGADQKHSGVFPKLTPPQQRIQKAIQIEFDPWGLFNTQRLG